MAIQSIPLLAVLKNKMNWHESRQTLLAENVANADTPNFQGRDLAPYKLEQAQRPAGIQPIGVKRTDASHFKGSMMSEASSFNNNDGPGWEITPEGNGVVLEEQMMKVTENAFDYQVASALYSRSLGILKTALRGKV